MKNIRKQLSRHAIKKQYFSRKVQIAIILLVVTFGLLWYFLTPPKGIWYKASTKAKRLLYSGEYKKLYNKDDPFLIHTKGCSIQNMDPFSPEVTPFLGEPHVIKCNGEVLTYISKEGDDVFLNLNQTVTKNESLVCWYKGLERNMNSSTPDDLLRYTTKKATKFTKRILVRNKKDTVIAVWCENEYINYHYIFHNEKQSNYYSPSKPNVLVIGVDSMSRSSLLRTMPDTVEFLMKNDWVDLKGYNKIFANTYSNLMAMMTGLNREWETGGFVDFNNFIFHYYKNHNYTTLYSEDFAEWSTFNYVDGTSRGFLNPPTNYYLRPYYLAMFLLKKKQFFCGTYQCFGPENIGHRMLKFVKEYHATIKNRSNSFAFFWMNTFTHNDLTCGTNLDSHIAELFQHLKNEGVLNNTFVIFLSDHGWRFKGIMETTSGWLENRLPFNFISVPESFKLQHKKQYLNLIENSKRLISPYDLYVTFHHIINLYHPSHITRLASDCQTCQSLFDPMSDSRTCSDAGISEYWCACSNVHYKKRDVNSAIARKAADFAIEHINYLLKPTHYCSEYSLNETLEARVYEKNSTDREYLMFKVKTNPHALFELSMVAVEVDNKMRFTMLQVERLDPYGPVTLCCIQKLKKYCYCK